MTVFFGSLGNVYMKTGPSSSFTNQAMTPVGNLLNNSNMDADSNADGVVDGFTKAADHPNITEVYAFDSAEKAQKISVTATSTAGSNYAYVYQNVSVNVTYTYSFSCDVKVANATGNFKARIGVTWLDGSMSTIYSNFSAGYGNTSGSYVRVKFENLTPPANAVTAQVKFQVETSNVGDIGDAWFKNAQFEVSSTASPYMTGPTKTYQISDTTKRYWDTTQPVTIQTSNDGSTWTTITSGFTIEYPGGRVVFSSVQPANLYVRASASAYTVAAIAGMFNWKLNVERKLQDTPTFGSVWNSVTPLAAEASGSCEWYWADTQFFNRIGDQEFVFVLYTDEANKKRYEFFGTITKSAIEVPADGVVTESLDFKSKGPVYYRERA